MFPAVGRGILPAGEQHTYLGDDWLLSIAPHEGGTYTLRHLERKAGGATLEEAHRGLFPLNSSFSREATRHQLASLRQGQLIDYDKETGEYRVLEVDVDALQGGLPDGLLPRVLSVGTIPRGDADECSIHRSASACMRATGANGKCGWCQSAGSCRRGDPWGACPRASCAAHALACGPWHTPSASAVAAPLAAQAANTAALDTAAVYWTPPGHREPSGGRAAPRPLLCQMLA